MKNSKAHATRYNFTNKQLPDGAPDECCRVSSNELKAFIYKDCKEKNGNSPKGSDSYRLVRSTGIEDVRRYEKSLDFQGFFAIERQRGRQKFF